MKKILKKLPNWCKTERFMILFLFFLSIAIRFIFSNFNKAISTSDELIYTSLAKCIADGKNFEVENLSFNIFKQILYPLLLSPIYKMCDNSIMQVTIISLVNSIIMSSVIFPVSLLCRKITENKKIHILIYTLVLTLPDLTYSIGFMSENLYYPLVIWFIYYVICALDNGGKSKIHEIILGILGAMLYFTKIVSLAFILAYFMCLFLLLLKKEKTLKQCILECLKFVIGFGIVYIILNISFLQGTENLYIHSQNNINIYEGLYLIYALFYNLIMLIIAFMFFPIVYSGIEFLRMKKEEKILFAYAGISLVVMQLVIAKMISVKEDLGKLAPRQHLRYIAPLFVIYLIIFISCLGRRKIEEKRKNLLINLSIWFLTIVIIMVNSRTYGAAVDGTLLDYIMNFFGTEKYIVTAGNTNIVFNIGMIVFKILLVIGVLGGIIAIIYANSKVQICLFTIVICIINLANNYCSIIAYNSEYPVEKKIIEQIDAINSVIGSGKKKVLYIGEATNHLTMDWEVYNQCDGPIIFKETIFEQFDSQEEKLVSDIKFKSAILGWQYEQFKTIDYIVFHKDVEEITIPDVAVEKMQIEGVEDYYVYKNVDNQTLEFNFMKIPTEVGVKKEIESQYLCSSFENVGDEWISTDASEKALVYGPYCKIEPGIYNIEYQYEYSGGVSENIDIGYVDIYTPDTNNQYYSSKMYSENNSICLENVVITEESNLCEMRMFTHVDGVKFNKITVEKIK